MKKVRKSIKRECHSIKNHLKNSFFFTELQKRFSSRRNNFSTAFRRYPWLLMKCLIILFGRTVFWLRIIDFLVRDQISTTSLQHPLGAAITSVMMLPMLLSVKQCLRIDKQSILHGHWVLLSRVPRSDSRPTIRLEPDLSESARILTFYRANKKLEHLECEARLALRIW